MVNIVDSGGNPAPQELETFLPKDGLAGKFKITPRKDVENGKVHISDGYDPFAERKNPHPTSDNETLTHLLKASLGTGILGMPIAFLYSGWVLGIFATIFTGIVCTHCSYVLVQCAHKLYHRTMKSTMTFAEVAEIAFLHGPKWARKFSGSIKFLILFCTFLTYFGTCSVYTVIIAKNFEQVINYFFGTELSVRLLIAALLIPLILLAWIPNLKYLAPVSMVANFFMGSGLAITFYYLVSNIVKTADISDKETFNFYTLPPFFAITIFAMEAIGVVMPLENQMENPKHFVGLFGILNKGMGAVTIIYMLLGLLGYLAYGEDTKDSITLSLPVDEVPAQLVKILIALAVFCTFGLQFYVCLEIVWNGIKDNIQKRPTIVNYVIRTVMVTAAVVVAIAVPTIGPFMGIIGAFCFSILGLIVPVFIELIVYWEEGFGKCNWMIWKNIFVCIFGCLALVFGTMSAVKDIAALYLPDPATNGSS